jgi:hypothetical protein
VRTGTRAGPSPRSGDRSSEQPAGKRSKASRAGSPHLVAPAASRCRTSVSEGVRKIGDSQPRLRRGRRFCETSVRRL